MPPSEKVINLIDKIDLQHIPTEIDKTYVDKVIQEDYKPKRWTTEKPTPLSGQGFADFVVDYANTNTSRGYKDFFIGDMMNLFGKETYWNRHDACRPGKNGRTYVCAYAVGGMGSDYGISMPSTYNIKTGNQDAVVNAGLFFDMIEGLKYTIRDYSDSDFIKNKEYDNYTKITNYKDVQPGDIIKFKGTGESGLHASIATSVWEDPGFWMGPQFSGGFSVTDDQGSTRNFPIRNRKKDASSIEKDFIAAYRRSWDNGESK